ncbi:SusC/RagA family TonB-linked outer membrane protein [Paraflavisolibacter sp. H34]|uniref:SusC/RagA family TonB-linked outer membrane protein n=1 Tax=Huijunlia imazamoxiresistens TaxID=3127457 RepID=UPI00301A4C38
MNIYKKGLVVPALLLGILSAEAQNNPTAGAAAPNQRTQVSARKSVQIKGTIKDAATGQPVRAVSVTYQNYSAAITDSLGRFTLKVPNRDVTIMVQGEGYQTKEIALQGRSTVAAALYEETYVSFYDAANLPFGSQPLSRTPYAVTSVQASNNWAHPTETPDAFLQGKVAGLNAIRRSGTPNVGADIYLRGISSLYATNQPLVVIDGLIYDIKDYGGSLISNGYTNPLAYIDIKDIDNVTVLKDGSSMYGTKGANGVIVITTARAKELATRIDAAVYGGVNFTPKNLPVMDATQYRTYLSDLLQSSGATEAQVRNHPAMNDNPANAFYYPFHNNTDWQKQVLDNSSFTNYYLKVTGGDNIAKYALSMGAASNTGVLKETKLSRYNTRFNADLNLSKRMTASANLSFTYNEQNLKDQGLAPKTNPLYAALIKSPLLHVNEVSATGAVSPVLAESDTFKVSNPAALIQNMEGVNKNYRFIGSVNFNYAFTNALNLGTTVAVTVDKVRENLFIPRKGVVDDTLANGIIADSRLGSQTKRILSVFNDTRLSYDKVFRNIHHLSARAGIRFLQPKTEQDIAMGANSAIDQLHAVNNSLPALRTTSGNLGTSRWVNTYVGADYTLLDKYIVSFNMAADGSTRFGSDVKGSPHMSGNSFAILPSVAGAWLVSSEKFLANNPVISLLKLRASYGLSGNDDIGNYTAQQYYTSQNFLGTQGLVRANFGNDQLQWERVQKVNLGLDAALLNERLNLAFDVYDNRTSKMLVNETLPTIAGITSAWTNSGALKTRGAELSLTGRILNKSQLKWDLGVAVAHYQSQITQLPNGSFTTDYAGGTYLTAVGNDPNVFYGYKTNGVFTTEAEAAASGLKVIQPNGMPLAFKGGDMRFVDVNGDKVINASDRQVIGNPNPDYFGSITNRVEWKRFALEAVFTFSKGNDIYNYTRRQLESLSNYNNQTVAMVNRWKNDGQVTSVPRALYGDAVGNSSFSDRWIEDGSYFRLRTASLSYQLPVKTGFLRYSMLYVTGNNLFTLTNYLGYDPEMSAAQSVFGQGVDVTLEPQFRSIQAGLRVGL